ncbi:hypothetical protein [Streptomyces sp. GESEQ-4]|uniref:hypothetical protein n=1 Tax=Streptomyces sp. GESEQ-4 TaxID=2812655 RepID=UPI001B31A1B8|nr:hypothetical protein [Streptomyces sp. GESEQ-4]
MSDRPPNPYTIAALARLVLADRARDTVDEALRLVPTLDDDQRTAQELLLQALRVRSHVDKLVEAAVLHARESGSDWTGIAVAIGIRTESVAERWLPQEQRWHAGLAHPLRHEPGAELPELTIPQAAYAPEDYAHDLDGWAGRHLDPVESERWRERGLDATRPVSGGLARAGDADAGDP